MKRTTSILLATAALGLAAAAPASADSIAYIDDGNVWLAATDGQYASQVTTTGGYYHVSQADDGTLAAVVEGGVRHLSRTGDVLSEVDTWAQRPVEPENDDLYSEYGGLLDVDVSPDAKQFAFGTSKRYHDNSVSDAYGISRIDQFTPVNPIPFESDWWSQPEWIDNDTILLSDGDGQQYRDHVAISRGGRKETWFTDPDYATLMDGTISRDHRVLAFVAGADRQHIGLYRDDDGQLLGGVRRCDGFGVDPGGGLFSSPTLSADGRTLVWDDGRGLVTATLPSFEAGCPELTDGTHILPNAQRPDWGPVNAPGDPRTPPPAGQPAAPAQPAPATPMPAKPAPPAGKPAAAKLKVVVSRAKLAKVRKNGLKVAIGVPAAGKVKVVAKLGSATVASGSAKAKAPGTVTVKLALTKAGKAKLRKARKPSLKLTATQGTAFGIATLKLR